METAGGYLVMFVLPAANEEIARLRVQIHETRAIDIKATYLGLEGTDELAHMEDVWAMDLLEQYLFNRRSGVGLRRIP